MSAWPFSRLREVARSKLVSKKSALIRLVPIEDEIGRQAATEDAKALEEVFAAGFARQRETAFAFDSHLDLVAGLEGQGLDDGGRDSDGEAVAPFGDLNHRLSRYKALPPSPQSANRRRYFNANSASRNGECARVPNGDGGSAGAIRASVFAARLAAASAMRAGACRSGA